MGAVLHRPRAVATRGRLIRPGAYQPARRAISKDAGNRFHCTFPFVWNEPLTLTAWVMNGNNSSNTDGCVLSITAKAGVDERGRWELSYLMDAGVQGRARARKTETSNTSSIADSPDLPGGTSTVDQWAWAGARFGGDAHRQAHRWSPHDGFQSSSVDTTSISDPSALATASNAMVTMLVTKRLTASWVSQWQGSVAWPCIWTTLLTEAELRALAAGAHPLTIRPGQIAFYPDMARLVDLVSGTAIVPEGAVDRGAFPRATRRPSLRLFAPAFSDSTAKSVSDAGAAADAIAQIAVSLGVNDAGAGSDGLPGPAVALAVTDAGSGVEVLSAAVAVALADTLTGTDAIAQIACGVAVADAGAGGDQVAVLASLALTDSGSGLDTVSILQAILKSVADSATGSDALSVGVSVQIADSGAGVDAIAAIQALLALADSAGGTDAVVRFDSAAQIATIRFTLTQRSLALEAAKRSVDFSIAARTMTFNLDGGDSGD